VNSSGNGGGILGRPGSMTYQKLTLKGQMLGALVPFWLMISMRGLYCMVVFILVLIVGEYTGAIVAVSVGFSLLSRRTINRKLAAVALVISAIITFLAVFDYWPTLIGWRLVGYGMEYRVRWGASWDSWLGSRLALDTGWVAAEWVAAWTRMLSGVVLPLIIWTPAKLSDWALGVEGAFPQWREGTRPGKAAVESIPYPEGYNLTGDRRSPDPENDVEPTIIVVPEITKRGV